MRTEVRPEELTGIDAGIGEDYRKRGYVVLQDAVDLAILANAWRSLQVADSMRPPQRSDRYNSGGKVDFTKIPNLAKNYEEFRMLASTPSVVKAIETLLGQPALIFRDVLVNKPAHDGAPLDFHQDSAYWDVEPKALISAWFSFRDVEAEDGCLQVIEGSHARDYAHDFFIAIVSISRIQFKQWLV